MWERIFDELNTELLLRLGGFSLTHIKWEDVHGINRTMEMPVSRIPGLLDLYMVED